ncbi:hypothetical protein GJV44_00355 [Candidatus Vallotia cooleyia]|nr:hypothetical protein GJV44_00355 [Candidatus Vallotia cooleyia]
MSKITLPPVRYVNLDMSRPEQLEGNAWTIFAELPQ